MNKPGRARVKARSGTPERRAFEALIEEATVDCYNDDEAFWGLYTCVEEHVRFPFTAAALGETFEVVGADEKGSGPRRGLRVRVLKGRKTYSVAVSDLELPDSFRGREWLEACIFWESRQ